MRQNECEVFIDILSEYLDAMGFRPLSHGAQVLWWEAMLEYPLDRVKKALLEYAKSAAFPRPKTLAPADIIALMRKETESVWPTADEMWARAIRAEDERNTVVWCEEAAMAYRSAAPILASSGDHVAARMAFKGAYERLVQSAKAEHRPPRMLVSLGWDKEDRKAVVERSVQEGLLGSDYAREFLADLSDYPDPRRLPELVRETADKTGMDPPSASNAEESRILHCQHLREVLARVVPQPGEPPTQNGACSAARGEET